jgi:hypothetical protein
MQQGPEKSEEIKDDDFHENWLMGESRMTVVLSNWAYINWWKKQPTLLGPGE